MSTDIKRRSFLAGAAVAAASIFQPLKAEAKDRKVDTPRKKFKIGEPVLQVPSDTSIGVVWAVNKLANGFVEIADNPEMKNSRRVLCGGFGVAAFDDTALQVSITGLAPATKYWYRTITVEFISYKNAYKAKLGDEIKGKVYSFTTLGEKAPSHFCVMNDTHADWAQFKLLTDKICELKPAATLWNGDATNSTEDVETAVDIFLTPPKTRADYASEIPILFNNGNHDFRGKWIRRLDQIMMNRLPSERDSRDWDLRRNYAVRIGDIALIGLDTGEDKPDCHEKWFGTANYSPYRKAQTQWLADQFKRDEIANAPFIVASCHIPLYDPNPNADPGLVAHPDKWAAWQKECADQWGPIFAANNVQLVITAHRHRYRFDAPTADRPWAHLVTGGRSSAKSPKEVFPTVLDAKVENGRLKVVVYNVLTNAVAGEHTFEPNKRGLFNWF